MRTLQAAAACLLTIVALPAQTLTPREVFYGETAPVPVKAAEQKRPKSEIKPKPWSEKPASSPGKIAASPGKVESGHSDVFQNVSETTRPLGLRYSVMKLGSSGQFADVNSETTFVSGDSIRLTVESNDVGYLYVVMQGSSGIWKVLYPSTEAGGGSNHVEKGHIYTVPASAAFTFDEKSGSEKLFVVLSRQPEKNLENLIYSLQDKAPKKGEQRQMLASNIAPVQDELVQRLRETYSRDLLIEKVNDDPPVPEAATSKVRNKEKAVYVVNPRAGTNASVVADIELRHQ